jgi:hypothetical protein
MTELAIESTASDRVDVGDGISIPSAWDVVVTGEPGVPGTVRLRAEFDPVHRRAVAATVRVDRDGEGDEVTAQVLREVRVQWVVAASAWQLVTVARNGGDPEPLAAYLAKVRAMTDRTATEARDEAILLYRIASVVNLAPLKLIADTLQVSVSTATRMMAKARQDGLATDLITRETYNRMQEEQMRRSGPNRRHDSGPYRPPGGPSGPSLGL